MRSGLGQNLEESHSERGRERWSETKEEDIQKGMLSSEPMLRDEEYKVCVSERQLNRS